MSPDLSHPAADLVAAEALGALDATDRPELERALAASPALRELLREYREVAALLAFAAPDAAPTDALRERVLDRVAREKVRALPAARGRAAGLPWLAWGALAASLAAAAVLGREASQLKDALGRQAALLADREARLATREATLNALLEPGVSLHRLTGTTAPEPGIQLFWDRPRRRITLHAFNLPPAPGGKVYQLWLLKDGRPVPSITFNTEPSGHALVERVPAPADEGYELAAVTAEPPGGSPAPTGAILLAGGTTVAGR